MACEKPVILAGNYGYLGLFTPEILPDCIRTNFTARGFGKPGPARLADDCTRALTFRKRRRGPSAKPPGMSSAAFTPLKKWSGTPPRFTAVFIPAAAVNTIF
jgi:hypothetical protein